MSAQPSVCPKSSPEHNFTELRRCSAWGFCGRAGYSGDFKKCSTYRELETISKAERSVPLTDRQVSQTERVVNAINLGVLEG